MTCVCKVVVLGMYSLLYKRRSQPKNLLLETKTLILDGFYDLMIFRLFFKEEFKSS